MWSQSGSSLSTSTLLQTLFLGVLNPIQGSKNIVPLLEDNEDRKLADH